MNLGVLGADGFGGQVSEDEAGIGAVGQANATRRPHSKRMAAVNSLELMALGSPMGEGCEDQEARHEAEGTGCKGVSGLEGGTVPCWPHGSRQPRHLTAER